MNKNTTIIIVVFIIISFFVFRHCVVPGISMVEKVSSSFLYPLLRIQQLIIDPIAAKIQRSARVHELEHNIEEMRKQYEMLYAEHIALKAGVAYTDETIELHNFNKRYVLNSGITAQVLARHFSSNNQFFLVNAGVSQGIKKDMVALYCNNIVGRVSEVYPWYCKVCLITDADCKVASMCCQSDVSNVLTKGKRLAKKGAYGIHEGCNDLHNATMRYVSHLEKVNENDMVLSSGEGLVFPKGFALGKIVAADKGELFYDITVQSALDFKTLRYCTLISKEDVEK